MILKEINVFPSIALINHIECNGGWKIEAYENYQKRSLRNKFFIADHQGRKGLSIPLSKGKNEQQPIKDVTISYSEDWRRRHLLTLRSAYANSPYFDYYFDGLEQIYEQSHKFLWDFALESIHWMFGKLDLDFNIEYSTEYLKSSDCVDLRNKKLKPIPVVYNQVFEDKMGFVGGLSGLDILFNTGPEARLHLK